MTNTEKQLLTMRINDAHAALEYATKCGNIADIEKAADRYSAARKAWKDAKKAKPRKQLVQGGMQLEINLRE